MALARRRGKETDWREVIVLLKSAAGRRDE